MRRVPSLSIRRVVASILLPGVLAGPTAGAAPQPDRDIRVHLEGDWIVARQGSDETAQTVKLRIWGSLREPDFFQHGFEQLDGDPEPEYVVVSRNPGTGAYYKLQIIDFRSGGILTWSLDSYGKPRVEQGTIFLGAQPPAQGEPHRPVYSPYLYTPTGVTPAPSGH